MPDKKGNLYLFEAIELRNDYDRHIKLIENLIEESPARRERLFHSSDGEGKEPSAEFDQKELEERLKKLKTKRIKLNQAIQMANFEDSNWLGINTFSRITHKQFISYILTSYHLPDGPASLQKIMSPFA